MKFQIKIEYLSCCKLGLRASTTAKITTYRTISDRHIQARCIRRLLAHAPQPPAQIGTSIGTLKTYSDTYPCGFCNTSLPGGEKHYYTTLQFFRADNSPWVNGEYLSTSYPWGSGSAAHLKNAYRWCEAHGNRIYCPTHKSSRGKCTQTLISGSTETKYTIGDHACAHGKTESHWICSHNSNGIEHD